MTLGSRRLCWSGLDCAVSGLGYVCFLLVWHVNVLRLPVFPTGEGFDVGNSEKEMVVMGLYVQDRV